MKCSICNKEYNGVFPDSSLSPCCFQSLVGPVSNNMIQASLPYKSGENPFYPNPNPNFNMSKTIKDEFCDQCGNKLNFQRIYTDGKQICPGCFSKHMTNQPEIPKGWLCGRCGRVNGPQTPFCACPTTTVTITCTSNAVQTR